MKIIKFPDCRQTYDYDCGARVVQSVLAYYGLNIRGGKIMKLAGTNKRQGTPIKGIIKVAKAYGFKYKAGEMNVSQVKEYIDRGIPVILLLQAWSRRKKIDWKNNWADGHYVVAIGYDNRRLYFKDPSSIWRTFLTYRELKERWHDIDIYASDKYYNYGIVIYGRKVCDLKKMVHLD